MTHYRSDLTDIEFNLHFLRRGGSDPRQDESTGLELLRGLEQFATERAAAVYELSDRTVPTFEPSTGDVILPREVTAVAAEYFAGGWDRVDVPAALGGVDLPPAVRWAAAELMLGANPALYFYVNRVWPRVLGEIGTPDQVDLARRMIDEGWGGTMVLTEPDAGSDVGAGTTSAVPMPDGSWHLTGVKRFITNGDWDLPPNIVHLVLARPAGAAAGSRGLSMFAVPKRLIAADGTLGDRNGVYVTSVEQKMGLKASATCELAFGHRGPAVGFLIGDRHDGMAQMFKVVQHARLMVGTKSMATLSSAVRHARAYARERVQGRSLTSEGSERAPAVPIIEHPDVRRMLMTARAHAEGMRALVLYTADLQGDPGSERRFAILLPVVKGYCSERAFEQLVAVQQVFGGSGYTQDYPLEQYVRDARVDAVYEGTTGIQALDLLRRCIVRDRGAVLREMLDEMRPPGPAPEPSLARGWTALHAAGDSLWALSRLCAEPFEAPSGSGARGRAATHATSLLMATGDVVVTWLLLRQAEVALRLLPVEAETRRHAHLAAKPVLARWFAEQRLVHVDAALAAAQRDSGEVASVSSLLL